MQPPCVDRTLSFVSDFIRNSHRALKNIDFDKFRSGDPDARAVAEEVMDRNAFTNALVSDTSGK